MLGIGSGGGETESHLLDVLQRCGGQRREHGMLAQQLPGPRCADLRWPLLWSGIAPCIL